MPRLKLTILIILFTLYIPWICKDILGRKASSILTIELLEIYDRKIFILWIYTFIKRGFISSANLSKMRTNWIIIVEFASASIRTNWYSKHDPQNGGGLSFCFRALQRAQAVPATLTGIVNWWGRCEHRLGGWIRNVPWEWPVVDAYLRYFSGGYLGEVESRREHTRLRLLISLALWIA